MFQDVHCNVGLGKSITFLIIVSQLNQMHGNSIIKFKLITINIKPQKKYTSQ